MFMPFEIVSICVWLWYFFQKQVVLQLIHIYIKKHKLGLHVTDECLEQLFVRFPTLLRIMMNKRGRGSLLV